MPETPIFSPKFRLWSISFSQMTKIFHSAASQFLAAGQILYFLPFVRLSFSKKFTLKPFIAAHGRLTAASPNAKRSGSALGLAASQPDESYKVNSRHPHFHARACSSAPHFHARARSITLHFHARARSGAPIFLFATAHSYKTVG